MTTGRKLRLMWLMLRRPYARFRTVRVLLRCWVVCAVLGTCVQASAQAREGGDDYRRAIAAALQEYNVGNFAEAQALFERAHAIKPSARTFRGLGMACFELKKYIQARDALTASLKDTRQPLTQNQRREVEQLLERTAAYIGTVEIHATPDTATVLLDGQVLPSGQQSVELGDHELTLRAPGHRVLTRRIAVEGGKHQSLSFTLIPLQVAPAQVARAHVAPAESAHVAKAPLPADRPADHAGASLLERWWFWTAAGAIVAGGVITAVALSSGSKTEGLLPGDDGQVTFLSGEAGR